MFSLSLGTSNLPPPCTKREHTSRQSGRLGYAAEVQADTPRAFRPRRSYSDKGVDPILLDKLLATVTSSAERRVRVAQPLRSLGLKGTIESRFSSRSTDDSLDSVHAIVGWTFLTVLAFWTPVALLAYIVVG